MTGYVYFIKPKGMAGPIKIGYSRDPAERLEALAVWSPFDLEIVATIPGDYALERRLHDRFSSHHSHREWFWPAPELVALIQGLNSGAAVEDAIDLERSQGSRSQRRGAVASVIIRPDSVPALINALGGTSSFARLMDLKPSTASEMKRRSSIPVLHWVRLVEVAAGRGIEINIDKLVQMHAVRRSAA